MEDVKKSLDLNSLVNLMTQQMYIPLNKVTLQLFLISLFSFIVLVRTSICNSHFQSQNILKADHKYVQNFKVQVTNN